MSEGEIYGVQKELDSIGYKIQREKKAIMQVYSTMCYARRTDKEKVYSRNIISQIEQLLDAIYCIKEDEEKVDSLIDGLTKVFSQNITILLEENEFTDNHEKEKFQDFLEVIKRKLNELCGI